MKSGHGKLFSKKYGYRNLEQTKALMKTMCANSLKHTHICCDIYIYQCSSCFMCLLLPLLHSFSFFRMSMMDRNSIQYNGNHCGLSTAETLDVKNDSFNEKKSKKKNDDQIANFERSEFYEIEFIFVPFHLSRELCIS